MGDGVVFSDFVIVGGGIAGFAAGYFLARHGTVTVLEAERTPGLHSTGRSAALFSEYYGGDVVRALTVAGRPFFATPPAVFGDVELLAPRGVLALAPAKAAPGRYTVEQADEEFEAALAAGSTAPQPVRELTGAQAQALCPVLRPDFYRRAMLKPGAADVDVAALHHGFLRGITANGGRLVASARVHAMACRGGQWRLRTTAGEFAAPVVINAAGAWADEIAAMADVARIGLLSHRRTVAILPAPAGHEVAGWPMIGDVTDTFYAKPESGGLLLSPMDATIVRPGVPRADELAVAAAIERLAEATTIRARHVSTQWAGLRSSVADDTPVVGEAPDAQGFYWLAGLGGYGIQTAPAVGELLAGLVVGAVPDRLAMIAPRLRPGRTTEAMPAIAR
jgi:D-arginine dehydrogenase